MQHQGKNQGLYTEAIQKGLTSSINMFVFFLKECQIKIIHSEIIIEQQEERSMVQGHIMKHVMYRPSFKWILILKILVYVAKLINMLHKGSSLIVKISNFTNSSNSKSSGVCKTPVQVLFSYQ